MDTIIKYLFYGFFQVMLLGNLLWLITLHVIASALDVSWLDVEHTLRPFAFVSYKEMMVKNGRSQEYINERSKNIKWDNQ